MIVISDTTPIISLLKAGQLELLKKLFGEIIIPQTVFTELVSNSVFADEVETVRSCSYIRVRDVVEKKAVSILQRVTGLDAGESEAIVIAEELEADLLLVDEHKGRRVAQQMGIPITGTLGILLLAFDETLITAEEIDSCIETMTNCGIRISNGLKKEVKAYLMQGK